MHVYVASITVDVLFLLFPITLPAEENSFPTDSSSLSSTVYCHCFVCIFIGEDARVCLLSTHKKRIKGMMFNWSESIPPGGVVSVNIQEACQGRMKCVQIRQHF